MKIYEKKYNNKTLNSCIIAKINHFIHANSENLNSLFISPIFANDYIKKYNLDYEYLIFMSNNEICALKLIFFQYKFYERLAHNHNFIIFIVKPFLKFLFPKKKWFIPILFSKNISLLKKNKINEIKKKQYLNNNIYRSPINNDIHIQNSLIWSTYIIDLSFKNYKQIYNNYNNSLKKNIKAFLKTYDVSVSRINIYNPQDLDRYVSWVKKVQKRYRKSIVYDSKSILAYKYNLDSLNFIFEIFILQNSVNEIFSSLTIYGDKNYVNEYEVNYLINYKKIKFSTHDILRDEAIKYCLNNDINFFDFSGFNPYSKKGTKEYNIKFSKSKFNGKIKNFKLLNN